MNRVLTKRGLPASPSMIFASALLHGVLLALCAIYSLWLLKPSPPRVEPDFTRVTLTDYSLRPPQTDKVSSQLSVPELPPADTLKRLEVTSESQEADRQTVQAKNVKMGSDQVIPLRKHRRRLKKVEAPKSEREQPKKPKPQKPKENPDAYLQSRIAHLREQRDKLKTESGAGSSGAPVSLGSDNRSKSPAAGQWDEQSVNWFRDVRSRVNANWSVFGEEGPVKRVTRIAVRIGDDGQLLAARVDQSSGNETFDLSAMRAIRQAAPFPSMPDRLREEIRRRGGLVMRFEPGGMQ